MISKDRLKAIADIKSEEVVVPEWPNDDGTPSKWTVRGLSTREGDSYEQGLIDAKRKGAKLNMANMRARLVVKCVVNEDGSRYFTDADADWLGDKSASAMRRLHDVASRLCGMSQQDMEDIEKNLQSIPADSSSSD